MFSSIILSFREGFEAALIIGIILAYLYQLGRKDAAKFVYLGAGIGVLVSLVGGYLGFREAQELGEASEKIFEGVMMLVASGLIAYFVVWLGSQSNNISSNIKNKVTSNSNVIGLLVLSFLSIFREGMELVIFTLTKVNQNAFNVAFGSGIGIIIAVLLAYIIFKTSVKFNLRLIFKILGLALIFVGAEMFAEGILKFFLVKEELIESLLMAVFAIPSLFLFLRSDIYKILKTLGWRNLTNRS